MEKYLFIKGYDSVGGDVVKLDGKCDENNIPESLKNIPCFNTIGFFKNTLSKIQYLPYFGDVDGLYVKNILNEFPIKVINLERRPDRWNRTKNILDSNGLTNYERFNAIDGTQLKMTPEIKHLFRGNDFKYRESFIGCAMSHMKLWQELVDSNSEYFIILEDDIEVSNDFKNKLNATLHYLLQNPYIDLHFLGYFYWNGKPKKRNDYPVLSRMKIESYMGGFFGYIISKTAAYKYLHIAKYYGIQNGIDRFAHIHFDKLIVTCSEPHIIFSDYVTEDNTVDSDIQRNNKSLSL